MSKRIIAEKLKNIRYNSIYISFTSNAANIVSGMLQALVNAMHARNNKTTGRPIRLYLRQILLIYAHG